MGGRAPRSSMRVRRSASNPREDIRRTQLKTDKNHQPVRQGPSEKQLTCSRECGGGRGLGRPEVKGYTSK